eukprot:SAG22_NODE_928_length_6464_cov_2.852789_5_plen_257_part_00
MEEARRLSSGVWRRQFSAAVSIVNPGNVSRLALVPIGTWKTLDGKPVPAATRTLAAQTGLVLLKQAEVNGVLGSASTNPPMKVDDNDDDTSVLACTSAWNCSLQGDCVAGVCRCDQGWVGKYCQMLQLLPVVNGTGLDRLHSAERTSTWGGTILHDNSTGKSVWHMWSSELLNHCGIHRWVENSVVVHATSDRPDGVFTKHETVFGHFSHEPSAARAPTGEFVLYFTHNSDVSQCAAIRSQSPADLLLLRVHVCWC